MTVVAASTTRQASESAPIPARATTIPTASLRAAPAGGMATTAASTGSIGGGSVSAPSPTAAATVAAQSVALAYLRALQARQWATMWQMSHLLAQQRWADEGAFAAFLQAKFAPGGTDAVAGISLGKPSFLPAWEDVRFTASPLAAVRATATLTLRPDAPYAVPPTDRSDSAAIVLAQDGATGEWRVIDGGPADLEGPVLTPALPVTRTLRVPIMMYHHVAPTPQRTRQMSDYDYRLALDLTVTPQDFAAQLDWLANHGYQTITLPHLMAALYDGVALPAHPIILTFDDGYQDNAAYAAPALFARHMAGTFNVITGLLGTTNGSLHYMTWDQVAALATEGMAIESHTVFHEDLGILSDLQAQTELVDSRQMLTEHLGVAPQFICYPSGEPFRSGSAATQRRISQFVTEDGYVGGLLDPQVAGMAQSSTTPNQLTRIRVAGAESLSGFIASIGA